MNRFYFVKWRLASNKKRVAACALALALCIVLCLVFSGLMQGADKIITSISDRENQEMRIVNIQPYKFGEPVYYGDYEIIPTIQLPLTLELLSYLSSQPHIERMTVNYGISRFEFNSIKFMGRNLRTSDNRTPRNFRLFCVDPYYDTFAAHEKYLQNLHTYTDPSEFIVAGRDFKAGDKNCALVSEEQAYWLGFENPDDIIGEPFIMDFQGKDGKNVVREMKIVGVYSSNLTTSPDYRRYANKLNEPNHKDVWRMGGVILTQDFLDDLPEYSWGGYSKTLEISIIIDSVKNVLPTINAFSANFENEIKYNGTVDELNEISESIRSAAFVLLVIALILLFCAIVFVANMALVSTHDMKKSMAILKAVGYRQSDLRIISIAEFGFIAAIASAAALIISYISITYVNKLCVAYFSEYSPISADAFIFKPIIAAIAVVLTFAFLFVISWLSVQKFRKMDCIKFLKE